MLSGIFSSRTTGVRTVSCFLSLAIVFVFLFCFPGRLAKAAPTVTFEGFHDGADCSVITGWAWDSLQPNTPINVDILSDEVLITTIAADQFRQDLLDAGKGNGVHGFSLATPPISWTDNLILSGLGFLLPTSICSIPRGL